MKPRPFPDARPHGEPRELLPDLFMVTGAMSIGPMSFSRNMVFVREGERLTLVNAIRLNERGLQQLDALGRVTDVLRVGAFHGSDDPFYKSRYGCTVHAVRGQRYFRGTNHSKGAVYFAPDVILDAQSPLPIANASLYVIGTEPPEALLRLPHGGGTLVSADSLHNWGPDPYFNLLGRAAMTLQGFLKPYQLGPGWLKNQAPDRAEVRGILDLEFDNVLPGHGTPVLGGASGLYRPAIDAYAASLDSIGWSRFR